MKKALILLLCVYYCACKKTPAEQTTPTVTLSFVHNLVESNSMVRSTSNDFLDIIESHTPQVVSVTLKNTDLDKTYYCKSNEQITLPVGNYEIIASGCELSSSENTIIGSVKKRPSVKQSKTFINVTSATKSITLNLSYDCYAIFAFIDECRACGASVSDYQFPKVGKYFVAYAVDTATIYLEQYEDSTEFISTQVKFVTTYDTTNIFAEFGKYYVIHPTKVDKANSAFETNIPPMEEGEI